MQHLLSCLRRLARPQPLLALLLAALLLLATRVSGPGQAWRGAPVARTQPPPQPINIFQIVCWNDQDGSRGPARQYFLQKTETLIKTLVLFSSRPIHIYIINNDQAVFDHLSAAVYKFNMSSGSLRLVSVPVTYPVGLEDMINAFKLCATARLFIQDLVPDLDAGIFLDNDVLLLRDPAVLWDRFNLFSPFTAMAVAPVEAHYSVNLAHPIPYYGLPGLGLNAGVALMNLTRLRELPGGGFTEISRYIWEKYREKLTLADQDVLNLVGAQAPWLFQPLPCEWNYHTWTCRPARFEMREISRMKWAGRNMCPRAAHRGIGLLHGNCNAFGGSSVNSGCNGDAAIRSVYNFWVDQDVSLWQVEEGLAELGGRIDQAIQMDDTEDSCARVVGLRQMLTTGLRHSLDRQKM